MIDVTALGELLIDFAPVSVDGAGYPTLAAHPGGAPANFLAALNQYGCSTAMLGKVGEDMFGRLLISTLEKAGIDAAGVAIDPGQFTTLAFVALDGQGNRDFSFARKPGADTCLSADELDEKRIRASRVFHFGTLSLTDEPAASATRRALKIAREAGCLISVDPNLRKPLWRDMDAAREAMEWSLRQADVVKISDEEIDFLWGLSPEAGAQKLLREYGASLVYATLGSRGCHAANQNGGVTVPTPPGIRAVDTTGAGDIFGGAAMSRLLKADKAPADLDPQALEAIVRFACAAASLSTLKHGGISSVPSMDEVEELLDRW